MKKEQVKGWMHYYEDMPRMVEFSVANNCNLRCGFCGCHNAVDWGTKDMMSFQTFKNAVDSFTSTVKMVQFAVKCEPTLNKNLVAFIQYLSTERPDIQITVLSNGIKMLKRPDLLCELYMAGMTYLYLDSYDVKQTEKWVKLLHDYDWFFKGNHISKEWAHVSKHSPFAYGGNRHKRFWLVDETQYDRRANRSLHNAGGASPKETWTTPESKFPLKRACTMAQRMMVVDWDGNIDKCCSSWDRTVSMGNVNDTPMPEIWQSNKWKNLQYLLTKGRRDLVAGCYYCNCKSYRPHFYPYVGPEFEEVPFNG